MARTLAQVQEQIRKLEQQAKLLQQKEASAVAARIREAIVAYGFKPSDLFSHVEKPVREAATVRSVPKAPGSAKGRKIAAKYKDATGNKWSGRGSRPRWLAAALSEGKKIEDFAV